MQPVRYFAVFRTNTSLRDRVMVFTNVTRQAAWDILMQEYPLAVDKLLSEGEMAVQANYVTFKHTKYGTDCTVYANDIKTGEQTDEVIATYPVSKHRKETKKDESNS